MDSGLYERGSAPFRASGKALCMWSWAILGFAEQLEFFKALEKSAHAKTISAARKSFLHAAQATADFYLENCCTDGIPMWDTGAPNLHHLGDYLNKQSDPFNDWEPVDSSAAAIAAQGFVRLGNYLGKAKGSRYLRAGLTVAATLFDTPYLSEDVKHQGLLLHSVYHRPNGWDYIPPGQKVPNGESSMWGDYHGFAFRGFWFLAEHFKNPLKPIYMDFGLLQMLFDSALELGRGGLFGHIR